MVVTTIDVDHYELVKEYARHNGLSLRKLVNKLIANDIRDYGDERFVIAYFKSDGK